MTTPNKTSKNNRSVFAKITEGGSRAFEKASQEIEKHQVLTGAVKGLIIAGAAAYIGYNIKNNPEAARDILELRKDLILGDALMGVSAPLGLASGIAGAYVTHRMSERMHNMAVKLRAASINTSRE